jgi:hypothetical protein
MLRLCNIGRSIVDKLGVMAATQVLAIKDVTTQYRTSTGTVGIGFAFQIAQLPTRLSDRRSMP